MAMGTGDRRHHAALLATALCNLIHGLLAPLPTFTTPAAVPFNNGLYFFYQQGETSPHAPEGRIVRVGNHPRSQDGLKRRLGMHYSGNKNSSVFRKFLGGALLRSRDPTHACLQPTPGKGHWEKHGAPTCARCGPVERELSGLLNEQFWFRCVEMEDKDTRNRFEELLVATLSLCAVCKASSGWLGHHAYSDMVKESGLWNASYVFDDTRLMSEADLKLLADLAHSLGGRAA
jgi:hypothetical protein